MAYLQKEKPPEHKQQPQKTYQQYPSYQSALHLREGNVCVAKLASFGAQSSGYTWWDSPPSFVVQQFLKYRQELPFYRFS
ncbi:hypothetical protein GmHk_11G031905 [Glycine max]|nr:hypothetical protein GmHk_11G031905 [Glycine max]